jgi:hypothetical protein
MKQSIILWLGAFVVTFLLGFWNRISSPEYPVTGSFGIDMKKITYKFDKVYRGNGGYKIVVGTEADNVTGEILWRKGGGAGWHAIPMDTTINTLTGVIPSQPPLTEIEYKVKLEKDDRVYNVPRSGNVNLKFLSNVPASIMVFYFLTLYLGLMFSIRTGLDYFNENQKIKKLALFTIMIWIANIMIFSPVKKTYELSIRIGTKILPVSDLFDFPHLIFLFIWIGGIVIIFNTKNYKIWALFLALITSVMFLLIR